MPIAAAPRSGTPTVSQRWMVLWSTPKWEAKASWLSFRSSRTRFMSSDVAISELCILHSYKSMPFA